MVGIPGFLCNHFTARIGALRGLAMKKILIPLVALLGLYAVISVMAQSQSQSPVSSYQPSFTPSTDSQGVMGYRLGPGDILDVRIFGQSDLNSVVEVDDDGNISSLPFIEDPIPA